jgi:ABC-type lipoprotein release transport system permease subunit
MGLLKETMRRAVVVAAVLGCVATVSPVLRALRVDPGIALRRE